MLRSTFWRQLRVALMTGLLAGGSGAAVAGFRWRAVQLPEAWCYDWLQARAAHELPRPAVEPVLIVGIDDSSIDYVRQMMTLPWPWPRSLVGHGIEELKALGAKVIVLDQGYHDYSFRSVDDEVEFARSLRSAGNVVIAAQTAELAPPLDSPRGRWGARLADFKSKAEALPFAAKVVGENHLVFVVDQPKGVSVWLGGYTSRRALEEGATGLAKLGDLNLDHEPEIRELTLQEMNDSIDGADWVVPRDQLKVAGIERLSLQTDEDWILPRGEIAAVTRVGFANDTARSLGADPDAIDDDDYDLPLTDVERSVRLLVRKKGDGVYPSLTLAALLAAQPTPLSVSGGRLHYGAQSVPLDRRGFLYLTYPPDESAFGADLSGTGKRQHVRFSDLLTSAVRREKGLTTDVNLQAAVKGKVVVVGNIASQLFDVKATPVPGLDYGSAVVASALRTLMLGDAVARAPREQDARWAFTMAMLGALYALIIFRYARSSAFIAVSALGMAAGVALYLGYALHLFIDARVWLSVFTPSASFAVAALGTGWINFGETDSDRARVAEALGRFTSPAIVESVLRNPLLIAPKRRELTILFSDIAGFTTISESIPAPRLAELLGTYFTEMTIPVAQTSGHVDKFIGDAVMAFWNAPLVQEKHALLACKAALAMGERLQKLRPILQKDYGADVTARVGLNSGEVVVGELGAKGREGESKSNYTCLGDAVNLASRLEGVNKIYGTTILCGPRTVELVGDAFQFRELDRVRVKGKHEAVVVYELLAAKGEKLEPALRDAVAAFARGLAAYRARDFHRALANFEAALAARPTDGPSAVFRDRCYSFIAEPPPGSWDGGHTLLEK